MGTTASAYLSPYLTESSYNHRELSLTQEPPQREALVTAHHQLVQEPRGVVLLHAGLRTLALEERGLGWVRGEGGGRWGVAMRGEVSAGIASHGRICNAGRKGHGHTSTIKRQ